MHKLIADLKLKDGTVYPKGGGVEVAFNGSLICTLHGLRTEPIKVRCGSLPKLVSGFKSPSISQLERWTFDSVCESMTGDTTEPDGYGGNGAPSWLMALGYI